jgi:uncharacterized repeat protein (TIGR03837 family)
MHFTTVDIFCHVIDNFGDIGVVYRFAKEFKYANPLCRVRVFVSDLKPLASILPPIDPAKTMQEIGAIEYIDSSALALPKVNELGVAEVLIEAFGCDIPEMVMRLAEKQPTLIINLEYLSAEKWAFGYHLKQSLLGQPLLIKYFFMPGITENSGGVIIDTQVEQAREDLLRNRPAHLDSYLKICHVSTVRDDQALFGSIFTYVRGFDTLLTHLQDLKKPVYLFVFGDKSHESMLNSLHRFGGQALQDKYYRLKNIHALFMPFLPQTQYDRLLCLTDFNLVRGEDSFVRALLSEKPFIWNAYIQENSYQSVKVSAFLDVFKTYFEDACVFKHYSDLVLEFNQAASELPRQTTSEKYGNFFSDLNKIEHATEKMSYFIRLNCDLVKKFTSFLNQI